MINASSFKLVGLKNQNTAWSLTVKNITLETNLDKESLTRDTVSADGQKGP